MGTSEAISASESSSEETRDVENEKKSPTPNEDNGYSSDSKSFEPTIDMLMQENFDYEYDRSSEDSRSQQSELNNDDEWERLIEEGEFPIDDLRAKYGYFNNFNSSEKQQQLDYMRCSQRSGTSYLSYNERSSGSEYEGYTKKPVRIGADYQAEVPDAPSLLKYDPDDTCEDLTWEPSICSSEEMERIYSYFSKSYSRVPFDDEEVYKLIMKHKGRFEDIINDKETIKSILQKQESALVDFSIDECLLFKDAVLTCGKKFREIKNKFYPHRSIKELIHFYYIWKKTPAYEGFLQEFESRKRKQAAESLTFEREDEVNESPVYRDGRYVFHQDPDLPPDSKIRKFS